MFIDPYFLLFVRYCQFFFVKMQTKQDQTAIIGCNLSKKHKLALYKTQSGEPKVFFNILLGATSTKLGNRYPNTIELASWSVDVLCDFEAT